MTVFDAKLLHAVVKVRPVDSQSCSGPTGTGDNPPGGFKSLAYVVSLRFFQRNCLLGLGLVRGLQAWATQDILRAGELRSELCSRAGRPVLPSLGFRSRRSRSLFSLEKEGFYKG
jgi:hypothetical protein